MHNESNELMEGTPQFDSSTLTVDVTAQQAIVSVPNRGTSRMNYAIGYCWLKYRQLDSCASVESTDDEIRVVFNLNKSPFPQLDDELGDWLHLFRYELAEWTRYRFCSFLKENEFIFAEQP